MDDLSDLLWSLPGLLLAIAGHEFAHAAVADRLGDPTPRRLGRLTLNPLAHIDPVGLLMLVVFRFGWARPVPVDPYRFRDPRRGMLLVAAAGPLANVVMAFAFLVLLRAGMGALGPVAVGVLELGLLYNVVLAVFNILPVPPLDGSRILAAVLPPDQAARVEQLEPYGWLILVALIVTDVIDRIMVPLERGLLGLLQHLAGALGV